MPPAPAVLLGWDPLVKQLRVIHRQPDSALPSYFRMNGVDPIWALISGWHGADRGYRWSTPHARRERQVRVELKVPPEYRRPSDDPRGLGVAVVSFGFATGQ